jgi:hypothetical protein
VIRSAEFPVIARNDPQRAMATLEAEVFNIGGA